MNLSPYEEQSHRRLRAEDDETRLHALMFGDGAETERMSIGQFVFSVKRHWKKLAAFCAVSLLVCYIVSKRITPMYEATSSLEFNRETPTGVVGQDAIRSAWIDSDQFMATQIKVIQEDSVLRPLVLRYKLDGDGDSQDGPVKLKQLRVTRPPNTYLVQISYRSHDPKLAATVANGIADGYLKQTFRAKLDDIRSQTSFMEHQLDELRAGSERSMMAVAAFERKQGVIDPTEKTNILSARLMQLNTEYTVAQADRIKKESEFAGLQSGSMAAAQQSDQGNALEPLQESLHESQRKFVELKAHYGSAHPEYARQSALIAELQSQLDATKASVVGRSEVAFKDALHREEILKRELSQAKTAYDDLNSRSYQYQTLKSEAETTRKLYNDLEQRIKEAGINGNFQNGNTHISDLARPPSTPLYPLLPLNLGLTFGFSLLIGLAAVIIYDNANDKVQDVSQLEGLFRTEVLGAIPSLHESKATVRLHAHGTADDESPSLLGATGIDSGKLIGGVGYQRRMLRISQYQEAVRMMWSSFQLTNFGNKYRSVMVTSAASGDGKTTISAQFALANARQERRTLLIDADLRRPNAHRATEVPVSPGLAEALTAPELWRNCLSVSPMSSNLDVLAAGSARRGAADDLIRFLPQLIADAELTYDLVIVDTPPLLSFSESLHMATMVDGVIVVACADKTTRTSILTVLQTLGRLRSTITGIVLNRSDQQTADGYNYYADYQTPELESQPVKAL